MYVFHAKLHAKVLMWFAFWATSSEMSVFILKNKTLKSWFTGNCTFYDVTINQVKTHRRFNMNINLLDILCVNKSFTFLFCDIKKKSELTILFIGIRQTRSVLSLNIQFQICGCYMGENVIPRQILMFSNSLVGVFYIYIYIRHFLF